jgi:hypothetical protein
MTDRARWAAILGYYLVGVFSAAQLGKMSALAPVLAADLRLGLTTVAVAISLSWRWAMAVGGVLALVALLACAWARPARPDPAVPAGPAAPGRVGWGAWCLALSFGCCTLYEVGLLALLPSYLVQRAGASASAAAHWTGVASVAAVFGSLAAAWAGALSALLAVPLAWRALRGVATAPAGTATHPV